MKRTFTLLVAMGLLVLLIAPSWADPIEKPQQVKAIALTATPVNITPQLIQPDQGGNRAFCDGEWQGGLAYFVGGWLYGEEYYAAYQDPVETGCLNTYPFEVTAINWAVHVQQALTVEMQPLVFDYGDPDVIGNVICPGPLYTVSFPSPGAYIVSLPFPDPCCVTGPYYAGLWVPTALGFDLLDVVVDDGVIVPPRSNATYNNYNGEWLDLIDDAGFTWNLELWSEGLNSLEGNCGSNGVSLIDPDTMHTYQAYTVPVLTTSIYVGDITDGHTVVDIDPSTVQINGGIAPVATTLLGSHPDFTGGVLEITCPMRDFILGYMTFWDTVSETYTVSGMYYDGSPFLFLGDVTLIGHISGDLNLDGQVNIADLTYMVSYLFLGGPAPNSIESGDLDGDGVVTISDLQLLIARVIFG
ncbi:MAG: dockerin type I repeat-containing protein [candidate division Zixibacteria bacterium]|nr:dockerin type I repeat-containing protein [candidate division Zixibacteria bacterium]